MYSLTMHTLHLHQVRSHCVCVCVCVCVCQNDILHWVNTPTLDSCSRLVGHHRQGAECDPVESQPLNIRVYAQPLACGCKLSKITTLACAVTMTVCHNEKKVPVEWQARQATQAIVQVSSSKHNAKKITTRERGPFHQSITAILTEKKRREAVY